MTVLTHHRKRITFLLAFIVTLFSLLSGYLGYLMIFKSEEYSSLAKELHERERKIKALRGRILDRNGIVLASNRTVCTISVVHNQITDKEKVISVLAQELSMDEETIRKKVEKYSSMERIKTNVDRSVGDRIRKYNLDGVKVDEDYKRFYAYDELASKVIGFTGSDNQGIIGLEVKYDSYLTGKNGAILTLTDAKGMELKNEGESRYEPVKGDDLVTTLDYNIQSYATQLANKTLISKGAKSVSIIVMNPDNGELYAMVNAPEYNLNTPYELNFEIDEVQRELLLDNKYKTDMLNKMWRNTCINDTYEPGSIFKTVTATAALEKKVVSLESSFCCSGYSVVEDRKIHCHKTTGHGTQSFAETVMNSCNPAFIEWGRRVGVDAFYEYMQRLGLMKKTGIDVPGEASIIVHKKENVGPVELATMSFGQSFQVTPIQMLRAVSAIINGGKLVTPHLGMKLVNEENNTINILDYPVETEVISKETSETMKYIMEKVVSEGGGKNAYIEGFSIGGKTATSQKLPRSAKKYIASFIGFSPVDNPKIIAMCIIDEPQGVYYGGTIAAPVIKELYENILPYVEKTYEKAINN